MAQHDHVIDDASGAVVRADINNVLAAIASNNSGGTAPSPSYANQWWFDTATSTLWQRNNANTAWVATAEKVGSSWVVYSDGEKIENLDDFRAIVGEARVWSFYAPIPPRWYDCNAQALSRTVHAALFAVIGTNYGAGDGSTTFNLPNWSFEDPFTDAKLIIFSGV